MENEMTRDDPKPWKAPLSKALVEKQRAAPVAGADPLIDILVSEVAAIGRKIHTLKARRNDVLVELRCPYYAGCRRESCAKCWEGDDASR